MRTRILVAALLCLVVEASARSDELREDVVLESDGWMLHGEWRAPADADAAVLLLHQAAGTRADFGPVADALAVRGIASLALDLRGHGESDNLGRFQPPWVEHVHINRRAWRDVAAASEWIAAQPGIERLGVIGASYSGEQVGLAVRSAGLRAEAYVMFSPGNFSDESIAAAGSQGRWLFVRTEEESPNSRRWIDALHERLPAGAPDAEVWVLEGSGHAAGILEGRPDITERVSDWFARTFGETSTSGPASG